MGVAARLTAYALALPLVFGVAWFVGGPSGPPPTRGGPPTSGAGTTWATGRRGAEPRPPAAAPGPSRAPMGRAATAARLPAGPRRSHVRPGHPRRAAFRRVRPGRPPGHRVRTYPARPAPLHAVVVRRDAAGFQRLDPTMDPDGTWRTPLGSPRPGCGGCSSTRPRPADRHSCSASTCSRAGPFDPFTVPALAHRRRSAASSSGWTATWCRARRRRSSRPSAATARASPTCSPTSARSASSWRSARAISPTPPPGAAAVGDRPAPRSRSPPKFPTAGTYRLFLQFRVADVMHTAEFTVPTRNP